MLNAQLSIFLFLPSLDSSLWKTGDNRTKTSNGGSDQIEPSIDVWCWETMVTHCVCSLKLFAENSCMLRTETGTDESRETEPKQLRCQSGVTRNGWPEER